MLIEGVAGSGGTVAIDDLILSQGCVQEQGELSLCVPGVLCLKEQPHALPVPLLVTGTILDAARQTLALGRWCLCPEAVTLHPLCQNVSHKRLFIGPGSPPAGGNWAGL